MKKLYSLLLLLALALPVLAQTCATGPFGDGTVAGLPVNAGCTNKVTVITDGVNAVDCTTGGGSNWVSCRYTGSAWTPLSHSPTNMRYASDYAGGDCGAKINAALSAAGADGVVQVDQSCGTTWTTAVVAGAFQVIQFIQGGTYLLQNTITAGHVEGTGFGAPHIVGNAPTKIKQDASQNLVFMLKVNTDAGSIRNLEIDGNKANNTGTTDAVWIDGARGVLLDSVFVHSADGHGIYVKSTTTANNDAGITKVVQSVSYDHDGDCYHSEDALDAFLSLSEFESCIYGISLEDSGATRIEHSDIAQNSSTGLRLLGVNTGLQSNWNIVVGNQFGGGYGHDIHIDGHDGTGYTSVGNEISGNVFYGGNRTSNTVDGVLVEDSFDNVVSDNVFTSPAGNTYRYGISYSGDTYTGTDVWVGNTFNGTFGTSNLHYKAGYTSLCLNDDSSDCWITGQLAVGNNILLGGYNGQSNRPLFQFNTASTSGGVTGTLWGIAESGVAWNLQQDTSGNFGVRGNYGFDSGTAFAGTFDHANTADRTWTMPDATGTVALTTGVSATCGTGLASVTIVNGLITAATCN